MYALIMGWAKCRVAKQKIHPRAVRFLEKVGPISLELEASHRIAHQVQA